MKVAEFLLGSIPLLIQFYADLYLKIDFENTIHELESEVNVPKIKTYDFIIVGGGSAGCLLAGRLSEFFNVLLLEAGGTPPPATAVPFYTRDVNRDLSINNFFRTVPQTNASLGNGGVIVSHTGRMLGGSSSHNEMMHNRGSPKDYDNWATLLDDDSFSYTNVLQYFKKMETFVGHTFRDDENEYYGNDGPIVVDTLIPPILNLWFDAAKELGYNTGDPNGYQREGFVPLNVAVRKGQRSNSYVEYVKPYERLRNSLTVIRYANVLEILLDDEKKAYGVAYSRHGFPQIAHAQKEIILSAGAYSTPLLLMKSGIGPESTLNAAEIPVKVPLEAVGKNLVDHPLLYLTDFTANDTTLFPKITAANMERILEEYHNGDGILSDVSQGPLCFIVSSKARFDWPDLWIQINPQVSVDREDESITFFNILGRPQSKGVLTLDTEKYKAGVRNDVQLAIIDNQILTHPDDMEVFLEGIRFIFRIIDTEAFKSVNLTYSATPDPACSAYTFLSDAYWKCFAQQRAQTIYHMVGTCSMGPDSSNSTTSVVDTKFRVRGVSNLRVVDSSVIPEVTNANLNAPVMMLAEKAAVDIISCYQVVSSEVPISTSTNNMVSTTPSKSASILMEVTNKLVPISILTLVIKLWI